MREQLHKKYILLMTITFIIVCLVTAGCSPDKNSGRNKYSNYSGKNTDKQNVSENNAGENMKKIAIIIAPKGYQDTEFGTPYRYFLDHGAAVDVYSTKKGIAYGALGGTFNVEHTLNELNAGNYNAIIFIGGPGTPIVRADVNSGKIAVSAVNAGKVLGAICWSPTILAKAGVLKGKNATVWYGPDSEFGMLTSEYLEENGASYTGEDVSVDGNIITANGPAAAQKYAEAIWSKLTEKQKG
jgi:protease I